MSKGRFSKPAKFNQTSIKDLPKDKPAVYKIYNKNGDNIFTGSAKKGQLSDCLLAHLPKSEAAIRGGATVRFQQMDTIGDARKLEKNIIARAKPKFNQE